MKIKFLNAKNKKNVTLDIDPQATVEKVRDEIKGKSGFSDGTYNFIFKGKILKNPGPFSSLKENDTVIVHIKEAAPKPPQENLQDQQPTPLPMDSRPQIQRLPQQQQQQQSQQISSEQFINLIVPILQSAINTNLIEKLYQPENDFYNHPKEVNEINQMLDESVCGIINEFLVRHFDTALRSFEIPPERILDIIDHHLPMIHRVLTDFDASLMELSDVQRQSFERLKKLNYDPIITLDTFIACEYDEERTKECLSQFD